MIKKLSIKNFKSIKALEIDCRRINLFIGEPNTGKSNILEALGLLSWRGYLNTELREYVRFQGVQNLFYDDLLDQMVEIMIENCIGASTKVKFERMNIKFENDDFQFESVATLSDGGQKGEKTIMDYSGKWQASSPRSELTFIKFYRFERQSNFPKRESSFLMPPHGSNMFAVVMGNKKLRKTLSGFFKDFGFYPVLKPQDKTFEFQKQLEDMDIAVSYPYILISDTLQRIIFHVIAIESNENSTLIFEEPESHAFPYYTGFLGERIAYDEKNQYFIATHNPYFLLSVLEKTPKDNVNVCITYFDFKNYQTKVKCLNDEEVSELMVYDPFANLDYFIDDGEDDEEEE
jgi:AAA15 family ATPase/GTPase